MVWSWTGIGAALVLAASCSFFFALAESALFALGKWRAQHLSEAEGGRKIAALFDRPEDLLATLALGNTVANAAIIGVGVWILAYSYLSQTVVGLLIFALVLFGCEVTPKALGVRTPEFWSARVAGSLSLAIWVSRPLRRIAQAANELLLGGIPKRIEPQPAISDEEYPELLAIAQQQGAIARTERDIILQILSLDRRTVREVMKPRSQISLISDDLSREEMLESARKIKHTRIPIYDENPDTIVGVLNARAFLLNPNLELEEVIEFPSFVPESMNLLHLLRSLQRQQRGIAIVLDEFGGMAGLVTLEDILEDTLGSFRKEPQAAVFERLSPGRWRVNGACTIDEFRREYPGLPEQDDIDTVGGLLVRELEYVPNPGESVNYSGLKLTARKVDDRRIRELEAELIKR
jgi:putative hemolysin